MRPVVALAVILLAFPPMASANQPPVAQAGVSTIEAVLFEPVVFTDLSTDADGTIASAVWTFTDGRDVSGSVVTRAFDYAGVHTISLRVTDDLGAESSTEVQVLVRAPRMHGRAVAAVVTGERVADTGDVSSEQASTTSAAVGDARQGQLRATALDAEFRVVEYRGIARATIERLYIPVPIGYVLLTGIESEVLATCDGTTRTAKFTQLRLNDAPLVPPGEVAPNTRVDVGSGYALILNAQDPPVGDRSVVTAVRLVAPGGAVVELARAEAGVSYCPYA